MVKKQRIQTLEALRAIAFIAVMFSHTGVTLFKDAGEWAVSLFLILSGFVAIYSQYDKEIAPSFKSNFKYAVNKIKKLYLLHVITTLSMVIFNFVGVDKNPIKITLLKVLLNLLLIQEWFPLSGRSINYSAWYLCALFLFYFVFPYILKIIKKYKSISKITFLIIILYIFQIIIGIAASKIPISQHYIDILFAYDKPLWIIYFHPLTRLVDIFIGCNLGYIFVCKQKEKVRNATKKEIIVIVFIITSLLIHNLSNLNQQSISGVLAARPDLWWIHVVLFTPSSALLIYLFAFGQGKISQGLVNKPIMYLAKISPYGFLIHTTVFRYIEFIVVHLFKHLEYNAQISYVIVFNFIFGIIITIVCCEIWIRLSDFCKKKYNNYLTNVRKI